MPFTRRFLHYSPGPADLVGEISEQAVVGASFALHRQGGCGAGWLVLRDEFVDRGAIGIGDWIAFEHDVGDRWYLGRVESIRTESPAGVGLQLEGMAAELGETFPGGFGRSVADGVPPHRYARTDLFSLDPDYSDETFDTVSEPSELVGLLMQQYAAGRTHITLDPARIEAPAEAAAVTSVKFRGEESVADAVRELAVRARNAAWGVDAEGTFFFLRPKTALIATYQEGVDLVSLHEHRDRSLIFNRLLLTGGFVYDEPLSSAQTTRGTYRWRGNYIQPASRSRYGERRIRIWVPWIRTQSDSREFVREFFRVYAEPTSRYRIEVANQSTLPRPWEGEVGILDAAGHELARSQVETLRVEFDRAPRLRMEIGPVDPHVHWPEPPELGRWMIGVVPAGDLITFSSGLSSGSGASSGSGSLSF